MVFIYNFIINFIRLCVVVASWFNPKAKLFVNGRRGIFIRLQEALQKNKQPVFWIHCASLGEFEQGRPVMELVKAQYPSYKILLTFFSPSGYELRKNYSGADYIFYLPWDTPYRAKRFVDIANPALVIFVKYEFWLNYSRELKKRKIPLISISSIFREDQLFFRSYGNLYREILKNFNFFFVQNQSSKNLLKSIGITSAIVAGDTRFDRVQQIIQQGGAEIPQAISFKAGQKLMVVGSCWPEDLEVLAPFINENRNLIKFIIAPHELKESFLEEIENAVQVNTIRFSKIGSQSLDGYTVLLIDNIGMLSRLYRYGEYAFVGGAFGKGLHNILEAACYGIPVFFGNRNYQKFQEANDLIMRGGAFEVSDYSDLRAKYEMINVPENFLLACEVTKSYVQENLGATNKIMNYCAQFLKA